MKILKRQIFASCAALVVCLYFPGCKRDEANTTFPKRRHRLPVSPPVQLQWRPANKQETAAAQSVVQRQFRAFRDNNYQTAIDLLASGMRGDGNPEGLRHLILGQYPEFAQVARIRWLDSSTLSNKSMVLHLRFLATNGNVTDVRYDLIPKEASYLISNIRSETLTHNLHNGHSSPTSENDTLEQFFRTPATDS